MDKVFFAKKVGEVLAFCRVGLATLDRGQAALKPRLENWDTIVEQLTAQATALEAFFIDEEQKVTSLMKADATGTKLTTMRDMYVGDQWDNATELCEWFGFFEGAAIVHWRLVKGMAVATSDQRLIDLANQAISLHEDFLNQVGMLLETVGKERSQA